MATNTAISVILPTLSRPELHRCVVSVLGQTLAPAEILVVDNGPRGSDTAAVLRGEFDDPRLEILSLPPYSGPGFSRNVGGWHASSPYLAFVDDDDTWAPDYLERVEARIRQTSADLLFATRMFVGPDDSPVKVYRASQFPPDRWLEILLRGLNPGVGGQNLVVRRDRFFALGGFPVDLSSGSDRAFTIAALRAGMKLEVADDAVVYLREPDGWRVTGHRHNTANDVKIMMQNWQAMRWSTRLRHVQSVYKRRRNDRRK